MILGADLLEDHSHMWVHWKKKIIKIPHNGKRIKLKGIKPDLTKCVRVSAHKLKGLLKKKSVTHVVQLRSVVSGDKAATSECMVTDLSEPLSSSVKLPYEVPPSVQYLIQQYEHLFS